MRKRIEYMIRVREKRIKKLQEQYRRALMAGCITKKIEGHIKWLKKQIEELKNENGCNIK